MRKMSLVLMVIFLALSLAIGSATAEEKAKAKTGAKQTAKSEKCWQRMPPLDERLMSPEYNTVCKAYEEVLNTTCEPPEKLQCNWTLPEGEKRFKKLEWKPLDSKEYSGFVKESVLGEAYSKKPDPEWAKKFWNTLHPDFKKAFEENRLNIKMTFVDIDHDSKDEQVVRYNWLPNCAARGSFSVMNQETKRVDWKRNDVFFHVNALSYGSEILLYEGRAFMFKIEDRFYMPVGSDPAKEVMLYEPYSFGSSYGSGNVCRFKYLKGGTKQ